MAHGECVDERVGGGAGGGGGCGVAGDHRGAGVGRMERKNDADAGAVALGVSVCVSDLFGGSGDGGFEFAWAFLFTGVGRVDFKCGDDWRGAMVGAALWAGAERSSVRAGGGCVSGGGGAVTLSIAGVVAGGVSTGMGFAVGGWFGAENLESAGAGRDWRGGVSD